MSAGVERPAVSSMLERFAKLTRFIVSMASRGEQVRDLEFVILRHLCDANARSDFVSAAY
jgi:hypothetical protein